MGKLFCPHFLGNYKKNTGSLFVNIDRGITVARGKIKIIEEFCKGCQLCVHFCKNNCIEISKDKLHSSGFLLPVFVNENDCIGCGFCGWMCPECTIEVYKYIED